MLYVLCLGPSPLPPEGGVWAHKEVRMFQSRKEVVCVYVWFSDLSGLQYGLGLILTPSVLCWCPCRVTTVLVILRVNMSGPREAQTAAETLCLGVPVTVFLEEISI